MRRRWIWLPTLLCAVSLMSVPAAASQGQGQGKPDHAQGQGPQKPKKEKKAKKAKKANEHAEHADERARFLGLDKNRNGIVSRAEWDGDDRSFAVHDWNRDGVLSGAELDPNARRPVTATPRPTPPVTATPRPTPRRGNEPDEVLFARMDRNNDRRLTRDEWDGSADFDRLDANKDGWLSPYEFGIGR